MRVNDVLYLLQEGVAQGSADSLKNIPLPKTFQEIIGTIVVLGLSPAVLTTMISAWANKRAIKDTETEKLNKKIEEKNDEINKKEIQVEILKVRLENTEKRLQELQSENRELKEMTNTGFTRQEQSYKDHIKNLQAEIESLKSRSPQQ